MTRDQKIQTLTANCACWKDKAEVLNSLTDEQLAQLLSDRNIAQAATKGFTHEGKAFAFNAEKGQFIVNAADEEECDEDSDDYEDCMAQNKGKGGKTKGKAPTGNQDFAELLRKHGSPQDVAVWNAARKVEQGRRRQLLVQIVTPLQDEARRKAVWNKLRDKPLEDLELAAELAANGQSQSGPAEGDLLAYPGADALARGPGLPPDYSGAGSVPVGNGMTQNAGLPDQDFGT